MITKIDKALVALAGAAAEALNEGIVPAGATGWVRVVLGFLTAVGVYVVPNRPPVP